MSQPTCAVCRATPPPDAQFCIECGAELVLAATGETRTLHQPQPRNNIDPMHLAWKQTHRWLAYVVAGILAISLLPVAINALGVWGSLIFIVLAALLWDAIRSR